MKQLSILVVDDDPVIRKLLSERLQREDYIVKTAENGSVAKECIDKEVYDVVITDLIMPQGDLNGIEVLETAKERNSNTEVLLITGHSSIDTAVAAMKKGANDYLEKPVNFDELFLRLDKIANLQTIHRNALDLREALDVTEDQAAQTIQSLEFIARHLRRSLDKIRVVLSEEQIPEKKRIEKSLTIINEERELKSS